MGRAQVDRGCVILGGGGHARMLIECLRAAAESRPLAILERDSSLTGTFLDGVEIVGIDEQLPELVACGFRHFAVGLGAVGPGTARMRLHELGVAATLAPMTITHPSALVSARATLHDGAQVLAGVVINPGAEVGVNTIVNSGAIVEHDCTVGDHVHVATGAVLAGGVWVGECSFIGAGATVIQQVRVGSHAVVGAGAVVIRDVPDGATVVGVPAHDVGARRSVRD